jgi:VanZ family protein
LTRTGVWLVAMLWMAAMLYTSSLGQAVTPVEGWLQTLISKLGHVVEYAVLGGLLTLAVSQDIPRTWSRARRLILVAVIGLAFAMFDELRQSFVPGREPRVTDVLLDLASVIVGAAGLLRLAGAGEVEETAADVN